MDAFTFTSLWSHEMKPKLEADQNHYCPFFICLTWKRFSASRVGNIAFVYDLLRHAGNRFTLGKRTWLEQQTWQQANLFIVEAPFYVICNDTRNVLKSVEITINTTSQL